MKKIQIITTVSAWPEALEYQSKLLAKFCQDDFEFIAVVDTDRNPHYSNLWARNARIKALELAKQYCDVVLEFPSNLHRERASLFPNTLEHQANNPPLRTADVCQFAWNYLKEKKSRSAILIDSDMFPIKEFNFAYLTNQKVISGVHQIRKNGTDQVEYFWNGIVAADFENESTLYDLSFDAGLYKNIATDCGGGTSTWLSMHSEKIEWMNYLSSLNWSENNIPRSINGRMRDFIKEDDRNSSNLYYSEVYADTFFHFRAGGNWNKEPRKLVISRRNKLFEAFSEMVHQVYVAPPDDRDKSIKSQVNELGHYIKWKLKRLVGRK